LGLYNQRADYDAVEVGSLEAYMGHAEKRSRRRSWPLYWLQVRSVSNWSPIRFTILIPIIGYWIIFNDYLLTSSKLLFDPKPPADADKALMVSWRLFATYFGLCFIAVASGIYQALCPREVKQYGSPTDYIAGVAPHLSSVEEERVRDAVEMELAKRSPTTGALDSILDSRTDKRKLLQDHFDLCNRLDPTARSVVGACYIIGAAILFVPTVDVFLRVTRLLVRQWFGL
jgi:hypothetical protein